MRPAGSTNKVSQIVFQNDKKVSVVLYTDEDALTKIEYAVILENICRIVQVPLMLVHTSINQVFSHTISLKLHHILSVSRLVSQRRLQHTSDEVNKNRNRHLYIISKVQDHLSERNINRPKQKTLNTIKVHKAQRKIQQCKYLLSGRHDVHRSSSSMFLFFTSLEERRLA